MRSISRYFLLPAILLLTAASLQAQSPVRTPGHQEVDLAVTYTTQYSNLVSTPTFWLQGGSVELSTQSYHGLGLAANITGTEVGNAANRGTGLNMLTTTFGPRYTWYKPSHNFHTHSVAVFGQALIGEAHGWDSYFPTAQGVQNDFISFALKVGGGIDIGLSRHFAIRPVQADWLRTTFPNGTTNVQNNLQLSAGVVFRFPQSVKVK